jgi:RIO kinase 1
LVVIDVGQAVDLDHPKALDFLREDCAHVNDYFRLVHNLFETLDRQA